MSAQATRELTQKQRAELEQLYPGYSADELSDLLDEAEKIAVALLSHWGRAHRALTELALDVPPGLEHNGDVRTSVAALRYFAEQVVEVYVEH